LFGLNPEYFKQFFILHYRFKEEAKTKDKDMAPYYYFKPEEKWLFSNYQKFLREEFPELIGLNLISVYLAKRCEAAKKLNLWTDDFPAYIQSLHDNGFDFMPKINDALKKHGITPSYSAKGWAVEQFYQRFLRRPLWKLKDAASIYRGSDPNGGREFVDFANINALHGSGAGFALENSETIAEFDDNDKFVPPPEKTLAEIMKAEENSFDDPTSLEGFVRGHLKAKSLVEGKRFEAIEENGELYFKPEMIVKFFRDYLPRTHRPEALYIAMELAKNSADRPAEAVASHTSEPYSRFSGEEQLRGDLNYFAGGVTAMPSKPIVKNTLPKAYVSRAVAEKEYRMLLQERNGLFPPEREDLNQLEARLRANVKRDDIRHFRKIYKTLSQKKGGRPRVSNSKTSPKTALA
jgi:hypothetical protein